MTKTEGKRTIRQRIVRQLAMVGIILAIVAALAAVGFVVPRGEPGTFPAGWTAFRDDEKAARYMPAILDNGSYGMMEAIFYRAARDPEGNEHYAYHPVWPYERNPGRGFGPFMSRAVYTGGLSLQRVMYGRGDVEVIALTVSPSGEPLELWYEEPADYNESSFSVEHRPVTVSLEDGRPLILSVRSWNHLFGMENPAIARSLDTPAPAYFDEATWKRYAMTKARPTLLRRDRAHFYWELESAE